MARRRNKKQGGASQDPPNKSPQDQGENTSGETRGGVVQLVSNQAGHLAGETFTAGHARALGIHEHCRPFPGQDDRAVKEADTHTA